MNKVRSTVSYLTGRANQQPLNSQYLTQLRYQDFRYKNWLTTVTRTNLLLDYANVKSVPLQPVRFHHYLQLSFTPTQSTWLYLYYIWITTEVHVHIYIWCYWLLFVCYLACLAVVWWCCCMLLTLSHADCCEAKIVRVERQIIMINPQNLRWYKVIQCSHTHAIKDFVLHCVVRSECSERSIFKKIIIINLTFL